MKLIHYSITWCQVSQEYEIDKLKNFVTETLFRHSHIPILHTFRLSCSFLQNQLFCARIRSWPRGFAVFWSAIHEFSKSPLILLFKASCFTIFLSLHLLTCSSLENISIHHGTFDPVSRTIHLPALRQLRFSIHHGTLPLGDLHLEVMSMLWSSSG